MKNISLLFVLLFTASLSYAQTDPPTDRELADAAYANKDYAQAIEMYQKILNKKNLKDLAELRFRVAESYRYTGRGDEAINWYDQAKAAGYTNPIYLYHQAGIYLQQGKFEAAQKKANEFLELQPNDKEGLRLQSKATFALYAKTEPSVYTFKNESALNTLYSEYGPVPVKDKLFFTSSRIAEKGQDIYKFDGQGYSAIYSATYNSNDKAWGQAAKVAGLASDGNNGAFTYCEKTKTAYFTRCSDGKNSSGFCYIVESTYDEANNTWSTVKPINTVSAFKDKTWQPAISQNGDKLYFVSESTGGQGGKDIWVMSKAGGNNWGEPVNLGNVVNTDVNEMFPVVFQDSILYFSSEGHAGYGGLDLFYTIYSNGAWSKPVNLKLPYNSSSDDFGIYFSNDKSKGYYTSNRPGGTGSDDIYSFFLTPVTLTVKGRVTDVDGNSPLAGAQVILSTATGNDTTTTDANGEYTFNLDKDKDYKINVTNPGYFGDSRKLTTQGEQFSKEFSKATGHNYDFSIKRIPKEEIKIDNIYYDYDSYNLREESKPSLDKLVKLLEDTPDALVQINSHTDERGKLAYNTTLSENRAKSVVEYLISKGINPTRLSSKGFAQTQPVVKGAKTEEEHQQNRRTTFQVLKQ